MGASQIAGVWTCSERELHINVLKLKAAILALQHWVAVLQGHHVLIATDNTFVVAAGSTSVSVATDSGHNLPPCDKQTSYFG